MLLRASPHGASDRRCAGGPSTRAPTLRGSGTGRRSLVDRGDRSIERGAYGIGRGPLDDRALAGVDLAQRAGGDAAQLGELVVAGQAELAVIPEGRTAEGTDPF